MDNNQNRFYEYLKWILLLFLHLILIFSLNSSPEKLESFNFVAYLKLCENSTGKDNTLLNK